MVFNFFTPWSMSYVKNVAFYCSFEKASAVTKKYLKSNITHINGFPKAAGNL
jgi:hypothetical protein